MSSIEFTSSTSTKAASSKPAPKKTASSGSASKKPAPKKAASSGSASKKAASSGSASATTTSQAASSKPVPTQAAPKKATSIKATPASTYCQGACGTTGMTVRDMRCLLRCIGKPATGKRATLEKRIRDKGPDFRFYGPHVYYPHGPNMSVLFRPLPAKPVQPRTPASGTSTVTVLAMPQPINAVTVIRRAPACAVSLTPAFDRVASV